jgi:hypothetical protein
MHPWHSLRQWRLDRREEKRAIQRARAEMLRAGVYEKPKGDVVGRVYAWLKGGGF